MRRLPRTAVLLATAALAVAALPARAPAADAPPRTPAPFAATSFTTRPSTATRGTSDGPFAGLGNEGYDVAAYDLALDHHPEDPTGPVRATAVISAVPDRPLTALALDAAGLAVTRITVDGAPAAFALDPEREKLTVTPARPLAAGRTAAVRVSYTVDPGATGPEGRGWIRTGDRGGFALAAQPDGAHTVFPCNDVPSDKARFTIAVSVPADTGLIGVASGLKTGERTADGRTTHRYRTVHPVSTQLVQIAAGRYEVLAGGTEAGVPLRHVVPRGERDRFAYALGLTAEHLDWLTAPDRLGPFPLEAYGILAADTSAPEPFRFTGLETQTLTLYDPSHLAGRTRPEVIGPHLVHELVHAWFGGSITPATWSDNWLSEGHANYYALLYRYGNGWPSGTGARTMAEAMRTVYRAADAHRARYGPVARPVDEAAVHGDQVYLGGPLALYALRQKVGEETFRRIETAFIARYRDASPGTEDYLRTTERVAGPEAARFLRDWLYGTTVPAMPGHPDWTTDPAGAADRPEPAAKLMADPSLRSLLGTPAPG
ncbi:M1 family metallopeptidase [Streptomyces sp. NPDC097619]|uniref:M1 family metallopeptidase n=1 Tax=Streptomyces sp. NPDC097619 TaxID=3157228 RepID=UPI003322EBB4